MNAPCSTGDWDTRRHGRLQRLERAAALGLARRVEPGRVGELLEAVIEPGDRVCL